MHFILGFTRVSIGHIELVCGFIEHHVQNVVVHKVRHNRGAPASLVGGGVSRCPTQNRFQ